MLRVLQIACITKQYYPETLENIKKLCAHNRIEYHIEEKSTCCGLPYFEKGELKAAKSIGEFNLHLYGEKPLLCTSSKCHSAFAIQYPRVFNNTVSHNQAVHLAKNAMGLRELIEATPNQTMAQVQGKFFFIQDCCSQSGISSALKRMPEAEFVLSYLGTNCCGAGTSLPGISFETGEMLSLQLIQEFLDSSCEILVFEDDICRKQIENIALKAGIPIKTAHIIDIIAKGFS